MSYRKSHVAPRSTVYGCTTPVIVCVFKFGKTCSFGIVAAICNARIEHITNEQKSTYKHQLADNCNPRVDTHILFMVKDTNVEESPFIDNSRHVYIPVRLNCGIQAWCRPDVLSCHPMVLYDLNHDLAQCLHILPTSVHPLIYRTKVWVNVAYSTGRMANPKMLNHVTAHHHEAWLVW